MKRIFIIFSLFLSTVSFSQGFLEGVKFKTSTGIPIINIILNGKKAKLIVDTGSSFSILHSKSRKRFKYDCYLSNKEISSLSKMSRIGTAYNVIAIINNEKIRAKFKCVDLRIIRTRLDIVGILGAEFLRDNHIIIDYKNKILKRIN